MAAASTVPVPDGSAGAPSFRPNTAAHELQRSGIGRVPGLLTDRTHDAALARCCRRLGETAAFRLTAINPGSCYIGSMIKLKHGLMALCVMVAVSLASVAGWADVRSGGRIESVPIIVQAASLLKAACVMPSCDRCRMKMCAEHAVGCGLHCTPSALISIAAVLPLALAQVTGADLNSVVRDHHGPPDLRPPNPIIIG